jgi:Protein of unknown function (DUF4242)
MKTYVILRRAAWSDADELVLATARSRQADDELHEDVRWIRSYILEEPRGELGALCVFEATSPEAIREHAALAGLPADEIVAVAELVVIRPDTAAVQP